VTYFFEDFEVDVAAYDVRQAGNRIRLARQPMELLLLLLERRHELVSREDIAKRYEKWEITGPAARREGNGGQFKPPGDEV